MRNEQGQVVRKLCTPAKCHQNSIAAIVVLAIPADNVQHMGACAQSTAR